MAVLGLAPDDDDGQAAQQAYRAPASTRQVSAPKTDDNLISEAQLKKLIVQLNEAGIVEREARLTYCSKVARREIASAKDLTKNEATQIIDMLTRGAA
jgi:hypothetical protein